MTDEDGAPAREEDQRCDIWDTASRNMLHTSDNFDVAIEWVRDTVRREHWRDLEIDTHPSAGRQEIQRRFAEFKRNGGA